MSKITELVYFYGAYTVSIRKFSVFQSLQMRQNHVAKSNFLWIASFENLFRIAYLFTAAKQNSTELSAKWMLYFRHCTECSEILAFPTCFLDNFTHLFKILMFDTKCFETDFYQRTEANCTKHLRMTTLLKADSVDL